jgi:hypothetical protein
MYKRLPVKIIILFVVATSVGCSSIGIADLFNGYAQQMKISRSAQLAGNFMQAETSVIDVSKGHNNYNLSQLEKGRLQFLAHEFLNSQKNFDSVYQQIETQQQAAKIQISSGIQTMGAVVSNDNVIAYEVPLYEQGMLHSYQALNYLYQGNLEGALVEVRRANFVQERALKDNADQLYQAQEEMTTKGVSNERLNSSYPSMDKLIGEVKNGFQNAYTFYLSGVLYEAAKQPNDAYIDYKRAIEIYPNNNYLQQDVLRLAKKLGMNDDLIRFEEKFGPYDAENEVNTGRVIVIFEQGIVNAKDEARLNLPLHKTNSDFKFFSFALPVYRGSLSALTPLSIRVNDKPYKSQEIVRLQSLASKNLQEQLPGLVTRQAIRLVAKEKLRQKMKKSAGDVGNILASLYNIASEKADTRSWSSLPDNVQIIRLNNLAAGKHSLIFSYAGKNEVIDIEIIKNRTTLINFTAIGGHTDYQSISL